MRPIPVVTSNARTAYRLSSFAQSSVGTSVAHKMIKPPMVGVFFFFSWVAGVPARTT
jgi:hypothetical protein